MEWLASKTKNQTWSGQYTTLTVFMRFTLVSHMTFDVDYTCSGDGDASGLFVISICGGGKTVTGDCCVNDCLEKVEPGLGTQYPSMPVRIGR